VTYSLHPGAEQDVANAIDFYVQQAGLAVAEHFLVEFERVANLLVRHPGYGTPASNGRRGFPYSVIYRELENNIRILVVRHQHRKPNDGGGRR